RTAAASDYAMRPAVFSLAWKILDEPGAILRDVVPEGFQPRTDYLFFLCSKNRLPEAYDVWKEIRRERSERSQSVGFASIDALIAAGMGELAASVWEQVLLDSGRNWTPPPGELLTNGDFEADLWNVGLDWRLADAPGYKLALDNFVLQAGSRSLRVTFDGT